MNSPEMTELIAILTKMSDTDKKSIVNLCELTCVLKKMSCEEKSSMITIVKVMTDDDSSNKKVKKDKSKPKRALNAFQNYCKEQRNDVMKNNPGYKFVDIQKVLGYNWNLLSDDNKQEYKIKKEVENVEEEGV
jgi:hypothetical protein